MNISLTPDLTDFVNRKVAGGFYPSINDVVRDGLLLLRERDEQKQQIEQLKDEIAVGIKQADEGRVTPFNEATLQRVKERARSNRP